MSEPIVTTVTIYLVEPEGLIFREWDGTMEQMDDRINNAVTATVCIEDPESDPLALAERVYALCNEHPRTVPDREQETLYRQQRNRSLSVGDVIHLPEHGYYAVANFGFTPVPKGTTA